MAAVHRPDYGIDAPGVVRNLFLVGLIGISAWALTLLAAASGRFAIPKPILVITGMGMTTGIGCSLIQLGRLVNRVRVQKWADGAKPARSLDILSISGRIVGSGK